MTTCTWNFRRHAGSVLAAILAVALVSGLVIPRASADQLSDLKAQAADLAARIQNLGRQEDALAQQYDAAQMAVQAANDQVQQATRALDQANAETARARKALQKEALDAYVHGGTNELLNAASTSMTSANKSLLGAEYVDSLATDQSDAIDRYHLATLRAQAAKTALQQQQQLAQQKLDQVTKDKQAVLSSESQLQGLYNQDKGRIATLVAQAQAAAEAAARAAEQARLAAARQAQLAAKPVVSSPTYSRPIPAVGHGAAGAVAAAESRLGDPYVWGAAGPNAFDCSGLVMWAYAQAGISLPHFSGAQYADTTHIPMSDLQPGDLVFPADPSEHVAMYVGGGNIIEAPHTGAVVHIVPLSSWFVLASRVA